MAWVGLGLAVTRLGQFVLIEAGLANDSRQGRNTPQSVVKFDTLEVVRLGVAKRGNVAGTGLTRAAGREKERP